MALATKLDRPRTPTFRRTALASASGTLIESFAAPLPMANPTAVRICEQVGRHLARRGGSAAGRSRSSFYQRLGNVQEPLCVNATAKEKDRPSQRGPVTAIERFFDTDDELAVRGRAERLGLARKILARVVADDLDEDTMGPARERKVGKEEAMARAHDLRLPLDLPGAESPNVAH